MKSIVKAVKHRFFPQSIKKRMILLFLCSVILPMLSMAFLMLYQMLTLYHDKVNTAIQQELSQYVGGVTSLMENMQSMSQQLIADGTVGQNLYSYFDPEMALEKFQLLQYLNKQIAIYESSNPNISNITYFYVSNSDLPDKINQSALTRRKLPNKSMILSSQNEMIYYGPHKTFSFVSDYPVISLVRKFQGKGDLNNIYIYIETGYRKLEKLIPQTVQTMDGIFLIISDSNRVLYSNKEEIVPTGISMPDDVSTYTTETGVNYVSFSQQSGKVWRVRLLIPNGKYYDHIYSLAIDYGVILLIAVVFCILLGYMIWKSIYRPFKIFDKNLRQIINDENVQLQVRHMYVEEFDESFEYFSKMKRRIVELLDKVQQEETNRSELQIKQLLSKINPHFICNTLDTLKWYANERQEHEIAEFISALNKLLLYNLEKTPETTLQSEVAAIDDYVALQRWKYDIDFQLEQEDLPPFMLCAQIPRFVLQPLIENAILHSGNTSCKIKLALSLQEDGRIAITVKNSGPPFDIVKVEKLLSPTPDISSSGIGLQYVAKMMYNQFGDQFSYQLNNSVQEGNIITLLIPFIPSRGGGGYDSCIRG